MAALTTKNEPTERRINNSEDCVIDTLNRSDETLNFTIIDLTVLILSVFSIMTDLCTDLILVVQYSNQGHKVWAIGTFVLIFFPSLIVQFFSLRWHIVDKTASVLHWVMHFCMLGVVHRYFQIIKAAFAAYKSKNVSDISKVYLDQNDLCVLHLFESFLESAPQLVLQMYVIAILHEWRFWTGLSAFASLLSLAWALAAYTKAQRRARPNKNTSKWPGLLLQAVWRMGMLTARISTLVLGAYCFGTYLFIIIAIHWIAMTIWIIYQKTDFCETYWEERIYNAVVGVIYCFCFFNLQEGQSRWRLLIFYLIIIFQNLTCLTIFLMWFADKTPKMAISGFIAIIGGTILGAASMMVYYRFFHPSGPIKFFFGVEDARSHEPTSSYSSMTLRSLKRNRNETQSDTSQKSTPQADSKYLLNGQNLLSDSIVIVEENSLDDTDIEIKILQDWINEDTNKVQAGVQNSAVNEQDYKRRAICSSVDLAKLIESRTESETGSLKLVGTDEASSEVLSAHDYENLAAVNIARETWGLRSWRGYSDIETWLHDDSVVHDRRLDTLTSTTSSDRSANTLPKENERTRQDDYMDAIAEDLAQCVSETSSDDILGQYSIDSLPVVYPLGTLDPIFEEVEESSTSTEFTDVKIRNGSASTLVATIDEIRRNTPTQNRYHPSESIYDSYSPLSVARKPSQNWKKVTFASKLLTYLEDSMELPTDIENFNESEKDELQRMASSVLPVNVTMQDKEIIQEQKTIYLEKIKKSEKVSTIEEIKMNTKSIQSKTTQADNKNEVSNKENIPTVANKISHWNKILTAHMERKIPEKNSKKRLFFLKVLTPPNFPAFQKKKES